MILILGLELCFLEVFFAALLGGALNGLAR